MSSTTPKVPKPHRRLLDENELVIAQQLGKAVSAETKNSDFACEGIIPSADSTNLSQLRLFYVDVRDGLIPKVVELPFDTTSARELYESGQPSPFGQEIGLVYDEGYRQAREIKAPHFALGADLLVDSALPTILMEKLNYTRGFLQPHKDAPQGKDHIGTLVLCLPSHFRSGDLVVSHGDVTVTFDWSNQVKNGGIAWGFLYSDCKHEVLPVEDGIRITIQYEVFIRRIPELTNDRMYDWRSEIVKQAFNRVMDPSFLPEGGRLAFGLKYEYPIRDDYGHTDWSALEKLLKGIDAVFMACLKATGLMYESFGVYDTWELDRYWREERSEASVEADKETDEEKEDTSFYRDIWSANSCHAASGSHLESDDPADLDLERSRFGVDHSARLL
ncbi:hypothetical protein I302_100626 [Kwoniella bestiolae CBS 10118]|uniref:Fe2OG dioxygenase domain-containing protein n=1 Tax=Kwoniella bestiolae CBS 10118 TaxID=1296100 RepID=A0A1B9G5K8_9TREE|nr:hypothetical protein I302_04000 [Kwoniella bestiolae CBS 10118]OCF26317.1 hypothetical protein I302_04000 [Kwoniella bestiolae CBS 10118]